MAPSQNEDGPVELTRHECFATTHWSVVLAAKDGKASEAALALEKLCRTYWPPLYAYIRRDGCNQTEAQDLTQEFFARLLARDYLQQLRHQEGKFRSFLLAYLKNFLSEQRRRAGAQKRGGDCVFVSLDVPAGEDGYLLEPVEELTPDQVFERRWAQTILQTALERLHEEFAGRGQSVLFELLQDYPAPRAGRAVLRATVRRTRHDGGRREIRCAADAAASPRVVAGRNRSHSHASGRNRGRAPPFPRGVRPSARLIQTFRYFFGTFGLFSFCIRQKGSLRRNDSFVTGSARAARAVFRALAEHARQAQGALIGSSSRAGPSGEGAARNTRGACAPRNELKRCGPA